MDATLIPSYMGLSGQSQGGLIAGFFVLCIILTAALVAALFNPCGATSSSCCCCSVAREDSWCYLCCSVLLLRCYYCCCCRRCCARHRKWMGERAGNIKSALQDEIDAGWREIALENDDDSEPRAATNEL